MGTTIVSYAMLSEERRILSNAILLNCFLWLGYGIAIESVYQTLQMALSISTGVYGKMKHENFKPIDTVSLLLSGLILRIISRCNRQQLR